MPTSIKLLHVSAPGAILWETESTVTQVEHFYIGITLQVWECLLCQNSKLCSNPIILSDFDIFLYTLEY
jgi:hypothetical protein